MWNLYSSIYAIPKTTFIIFSILFIVLWGIIGRLAIPKHRKKWRTLNFLAFVAVVLLILFITLFIREKNAGYEIVLNPLITFKRGKGQWDYYNSFFMNVMLFVPFGIVLPQVLNSTLIKGILFTILFGAVFSLVIEIIQGVFGFGNAETIDLICNTFGTAVGSISYLLSYKRNVKKLPV